jgi:hypothetical protein
MQNVKEIYPTLLQAHDGLTDAQSADLNARLLMILCERVESIEALAALLADLRKDVVSG